MGRITLQFMTQPVQVGAHDDTCIPFVQVVAAQVSHQFARRDNSIPVAQQINQNVELGRRQVHGFAAYDHQPPERVNVDLWRLQKTFMGRRHSRLFGPGL